MHNYSNSTHVSLSAAIMHVGYMYFGIIQKSDVLLYSSLQYTVWYASLAFINDLHSDKFELKPIILTIGNNCNVHSSCNLEDIDIGMIVDVQVMSLIEEPS